MVTGGGSQRGKTGAGDILAGSRTSRQCTAEAMEGNDMVEGTGRPAGTTLESAKVARRSAGNPCCRRDAIYDLAASRRCRRARKGLPATAAPGESQGPPHIAQQNPGHFIPFSPPAATRPTIAPKSCNGLSPGCAIVCHNTVQSIIMEAVQRFWRRWTLDHRDGAFLFACVRRLVGG
jgi:hypothetical protein